MSYFTCTECGKNGIPLLDAQSHNCRPKATNKSQDAKCPLFEPGDFEFSRAYLEIEYSDDEIEGAFVYFAEKINAKLASLGIDAETPQKLMRLQMHQQDLAEAAGDMPIDVPQPGTIEAKLLIANRLLRERLAESEEKLKQAKEIIHDEFCSVKHHPLCLEVK